MKRVIAAIAFLALAGCGQPGRDQSSSAAVAADGDVRGLDAARAVPHVWDVQITAKQDQHLLPLPEGASYLGFIFAKAASPELVERALRDAHAQLAFVIDRAVPLASV